MARSKERPTGILHNAVSQLPSRVKFPSTINSTLSVVEDFYRISVSSGDASEATLKIYIHGAKQFMMWAVEHRLHPRNVTYHNILEYRKFLLETLKPATVALRISAVRRFYDGLARNGMVSSNPATGVKVKAPKDQDAVVGKSLTLEELQRLFDGLPRGKNFRARRDRSMVALAALHGLRECEVSNLQIFDIEKKGDQTWLQLVGKGGNRRKIPLRDDVVRLLGAYLEVRGDARGGLFCRSPEVTKALVERSVRDILKRELRRVGLGGYRPHDLRHTSASLALAGGASIESVRRMLGHSSLATTSKYIHALDFGRKNPSDSIGAKIF